MRLLLRNNTGEFSLTKDFSSDDNIPPYAILSHTWEDGEEVTFRDLIYGTGKNKTGYDKIRFCGQQAEHDGLRYFWVDTCCIDKSNSAELQEAINSMFNWYRKAVRCYVYLSDVSISDYGPNSRRNRTAWESDFRSSRWFTRGWTLQELLAPDKVEFFSRDSKRLGDKSSLKQQLTEITGIPIEAIQGTTPLSRFSVDTRFSWAENHETTRKEDKMYSLLGIFGVKMIPNYGEGEKNARRRLVKEIDNSYALVCGIRRKVFWRISVVTVLIFIVVVTVAVVSTLVTKSKTKSPEVSVQRSSNATSSPSPLITSTGPGGVVVECPWADGTNTTVEASSNGIKQTFTQFCGLDYWQDGRYDIKNLTVKTMKDCVTACASYNDENGSGKCAGVTWNYAGPQGEGVSYCWIKNFMGEGASVDNTESAILL